MAKHKDDSEGVSLFPFMSILVCLIGGLTLMITAMMVTQANQDQSQEEIDRYKEYQQLKAQAEKDAAELERLRQALAQFQKMREQSRQALDELASLQKEQKKRLQAQEASIQEHVPLLAESNRLRQRITEIQKDPLKLQTKIDELKKELAKRKAGPEEAVVQVRSGGSGVDIAPTFVECTATGVVIHEGAQPVRLRGGDLAKPDGDFCKLLERVAEVPKGQVIFLVRPDGVGTYHAARQVARTHYGPKGYCKNGKLPIPTQGNLDLSIFRR